MRVALIDVDSKIPNLALMKASAWHKARGDECKHMVECCCDYGICRREYQEAFDNEFCECEGQIKLTQSDGADWALWWIPDHMRDMQSVACETSLNRKEPNK